MKYYIFTHDWDFDLLANEEAFDPYVGAPLTSGVLLEDFPKITLPFKSELLPDSVPNFNNCIVFNQNIISVLIEAGADYIQYFDVDVKNKKGQLISGEYKCLNILKVVDAIDLVNSRVEWREPEPGEDKDDRTIRYILDLRIDYTKVNNEPLFRLKHRRNLLLFREDVAQEIINKKCTGLQFYPADGYHT